MNIYKHIKNDYRKRQSYRARQREIVEAHAELPNLRIYNIKDIWFTQYYNSSLYSLASGSIKHNKNKTKQILNYEKGKREIKSNYRLYKDIWNTTKKNNKIELNLELNSESCSSVSVSFLRFVFWF